MAVEALSPRDLVVVFLPKLGANSPFCSTFRSCFSLLKWIFLVCVSMSESSSMSKTHTVLVR